MNWGVTNKKVAKVFSKAVNKLARNQDEVDNTDKMIYVCMAVMQANGAFCFSVANEQTQEACRIINKRLDGCNDIRVWLKSKANIPESQLTSDNLQEYRHRWLQSLIDEYSSKED